MRITAGRRHIVSYWLQLGCQSSNLVDLSVSTECNLADRSIRALQWDLRSRLHLRILGMFKLRLCRQLADSRCRHLVLSRNCGVGHRGNTVHLY